MTKGVPMFLKLFMSIVRRVRYGVGRPAPTAWCSWVWPFTVRITGLTQTKDQYRPLSALVLKY